MKVKDWQRFQHYKHRDPPWIKLHKRLLNDPEWFSLSGDASKMLANCWLLASENNGELPPISTVAFRLRMTEKRATELISQLNHWLVADCKQDASILLAECKQHATPESETESEKKDSRSNEFALFWQAYPRKVAKKSAERALAKALRETTIETIVEAVRQQRDAWTDEKFIPHPATWLNAGRWSDHVNGKPKAPLPSDEEFERMRERYVKRQAEVL